jgi:hypothetical protein
MPRSEFASCSGIVLCGSAPPALHSWPGHQPQPRQQQQLPHQQQQVPFPWRFSTPQSTRSWHRLQLHPLVRQHRPLPAIAIATSNLNTVSHRRVDIVVVGAPDTFFTGSPAVFTNSTRAVLTLELHLAGDYIAGFDEERQVAA